MPHPFTVHYAVFVANRKAVEERAHVLAGGRLSFPERDREFFDVSLARAVAAVDGAAGEQGYPPLVHLASARAREAARRLNHLIPVGETGAYVAKPDPAAIQAAAGAFEAAVKDGRRELEQAAAEAVRRGRAYGWAALSAAALAAAPVVGAPVESLIAVVAACALPAFAVGALAGRMVARLGWRPRLRRAADRCGPALLDAIQPAAARDERRAVLQVCWPRAHG